MKPERTCPDCGATLPADAPRGLCPNCLMGAALPSTSPPSSAATGTFEPATGSQVPVAGAKVPGRADDGGDVLGSAAPIRQFGQSPRGASAGSLAPQSGQVRSGFMVKSSPGCS